MQAFISEHAPAVDEVSRPVGRGDRACDNLAGAGGCVDEPAAADIDSRMAHAIGCIIFEEHKITFLQIAGRGDLRPFTHGREASRAVAARADAAGAQTEVDKTGAVKPLGGALFRPGIRFSEHRGRDRDQSVRAVGSGVADIFCRRRLRHRRRLRGGGSRSGRRRCRLLCRRWFLRWFRCGFRCWCRGWVNLRARLRRIE